MTTQGPAKRAAGIGATGRLLLIPNNTRPGEGRIARLLIETRRNDNNARRGAEWD